MNPNITSVDSLLGRAVILHYSFDHGAGDGCDQVPIMSFDLVIDLIFPLGWHFRIPVPRLRHWCRQQHQRAPGCSSYKCAASYVSRFYFLLTCHEDNNFTDVDCTNRLTIQPFYPSAPPSSSATTGARQARGGNWKIAVGVSCGLLGLILIAIIVGMIMNRFA